MDWRDTFKDPQIGEMYFDGLTGQMYMFKNLGDYPAEWINITPDEEETKRAANMDGWLFNDYNEIE